MILCTADVTSKIPEKVRRFTENFKLVRQKMTEIEAKDKIRNMKLPVDGNEIMERYHLSPSREVGILRNSMKDAILDGIIGNNAEEALAFLDEEYKKLKQS